MRPKDFIYCQNTDLAIHVQRHANTSKQCYWMVLTLVHPNGVALINLLFMKDISKVKVHLKTRSRNVNIRDFIFRMLMKKET